MLNGGDGGDPLLLRLPVPMGGGRRQWSLDRRLHRGTTSTSGAGRQPDEGLPDGEPARFETNHSPVTCLEAKSGTSST